MASQWSAARICNELNLFHGEDQIYFSGEMVFPSDLQVHPELKGLAPAALELAKCTDWPNLYDLDQLKQNDVPLYAAVFVDDMYVDFGFAQETASLVRNCKTYVTNAMYHDAVRSQTEAVARALFALRDDTID
jgi:hypothetical protein